MNSLLQKESLAGQVQMIYIDPPYGIKYGSNFQPFVNKRDVKDRKDEDLTQEPEMIKAFRDTWELGIHSYLTYLRDRLLLAKELLHESGSVFVQISDENLHHVRELIDEVFGATNFIGLITFRTGSGFTARFIKTTSDYLLWYGKNKEATKYRQLFDMKVVGEGSYFDKAELRNGAIVELSQISGESKANVVSYVTFRPLVSGAYSESTTFDLELRGRNYHPGGNRCWKTTRDGLRRLDITSRIQFAERTLKFVAKSADFPCQEITHVWDDTMELLGKDYVVQTTTKVLERCLLMTTDPGDLVLDPTCGSGTSAFVAEKWGRRWITCDTSRVSVTLAKQRLMTASYDYYELKYPQEGLKSGFIYKTVPHVMLKSIANNPEIDEIYERMHPTIESALTELNEAAKQTLREWEVPFDFPADWPEAARKPFETFHAARQAMQKKMDASIAAHADPETLYDQPQPDKNKLRISGPFTVEAVPFPTVLALDEAKPAQEADIAIARSGESARQHSWRDELLKTGIRGKGGQMLRFAELETFPASEHIRHLHVSGTLAESGERVVVSFGPEHAALEQRQVALALNEAEKLRPAPKFIIFASFEFDPEAAKDIDETKWPGVTLLKAKMNTDLLTEDLKKARANNQSFWLMGQPDVEVRRDKDGKYVVEVNGFDYFDTAKGELVSGGKGKIAMWLLDTDYDERSLFPRQVFFPMAGKGEGWEKLKKNIRAELNEGLLEKFHGTKSLPFEAGENKKVAVKIVDDRGIESLKVLQLD
jgi:adenine-specific DNA-methyltransferase